MPWEISPDNAMGTLHAFLHVGHTCVPHQGESVDALCCRANPKNKEQQATIDQLAGAECQTSMIKHAEAFFCPKHNTMIAKGLLPDQLTLLGFAKGTLGSLCGAFSGRCGQLKIKDAMPIGLTMTLVTPQLFGPWMHAIKSRLPTAPVVISLKGQPYVSWLP